MIILHLGISKENVEEIIFTSTKKLTKYIKKLHDLDCVWLFSGGGEYAEIIVTENITTIVKILSDQYFLNDRGFREIHIHKYHSFESAYSVALEIREGHPKCYSKC